jgi:hypothetical protein
MFVNHILWIWLIVSTTNTLSKMNQQELIQELINLKSQVTGTTQYAYGLLDGLTMAIEVLEGVTSPS